ncbi:hypothetical protein ACFFX1_52720 [Dactylosporangium sucinum]|uniref:Uncharacterized protein n=1 Tax=Dactylosporangium sucinum TaxID=1424081 RepID=A0A917UFZ5_9ACTN|nr:hypothetical protein [Dactylosporangium sucinum]GGM89572.1 hypothetical protein GCM10007977_109490 [Dactylosporangium sucinum]
MSELEFPSWPEHPGLGSWIPTAMLADVVARLPGLADADGWLRAVPDPQEPFPAVHLQLVWLADGHIHFATVSGCTVALAAPGRAEPRLAAYHYASLEQLVAGAADWASDVRPPGTPA